MHRGRAHAGHVEVLLAAWYSVELTRRSSGNLAAPLDWLLSQLHTLRRAILGPARSAVIMIDSQPCATCLRFINRLFQYTGLHFSVRGAVGVGPTLATKDQRSNMRFDTFGDVFPESEGEEVEVGGCGEVDDNDDDDNDDNDKIRETGEASIGLGSPSSVVRETAAAATPDVRGDNINTDGIYAGNTTHMNNVQTAAAAAAASSQPYANSSLPTPPRSSPVPEPATSQATPTPTPAEHTTTTTIIPVTPARSRMQWPLPEHRIRTPHNRTATKDPFRDIPSRRPPNHFELLAEYKKKTPVYHFPGYEAVVAQQQRQQQQQQQQQASQQRRLRDRLRRSQGQLSQRLATPPPLVPLALRDVETGAVGWRSRGGEGEGEVVLVDAMGDRDVGMDGNNDDHNHVDIVLESIEVDNSNSNSSNIGAAAGRAYSTTPASNTATTTLATQRLAAEVGSHMKDRSNHFAAPGLGIFSYSSFEPVARDRERGDHADAHTTANDNDNAHARVDPHNHHIFPSPSPSREVHMKGSDSDGINDLGARAEVEAEEDEDEDEDGYYMIRSLVRQAQSDAVRNNHLPRRNEEGEGEDHMDATPCPVPVPGVVRLQKWRYHPQPRPQPRLGAAPWALRVRDGVRPVSKFQPMTRFP